MGLRGVQNAPWGSNGVGLETVYQTGLVQPRLGNRWPRLAYGTAPTTPSAAPDQPLLVAPALPAADQGAPGSS